MPELVPLTPPRSQPMPDLVPLPPPTSQPMPELVPLTPIPTEQSPTVEAIKAGVLGLPERGQELFATVAAAETRRLETKKRVAEQIKAGIPFEKIMALVMCIGVDPAETVLFQNDAIAVL